MRKVFALGLLLFALATVFARPAHAVTERVTATNSGTFTMTLAGAAGTNPLGPATDATATLTYRHDSTNTTAESVTAQVTATALSGGAVACHDITLTVSVATGTGTKTLVNAGTIGPAVTVMSGLTATQPAQTITYTATSTAGGTVAGTYRFTVSYVGSGSGSTSNKTATAVAAVTDSLGVTSSSGSFSLPLAGAAGTNPMGPVSDSTATLNYTHNANVNKSITALVTGTVFPAGGNPDDITLTVSVAGGAGTKTLITAGTNQAAQTVYSAIAKGALSNKAVTYTASGNASGTTQGIYTFTITYTSL